MGILAQLLSRVSSVSAEGDVKLVGDVVLVAGTGTTLEQDDEQGTITFNSSGGGGAMPGGTGTVRVDGGVATAPDYFKAGAIPAASGQVRLANTSSIKARNVGNDADENLISHTSSLISVGDTVRALALYGTSLAIEAMAVGGLGLLLATSGGAVVKAVGTAGQVPVSDGTNVAMGKIADASVDAAAAIAVTKLALGPVRGVLWSNGSANSWTATPTLTALALANDDVLTASGAALTVGATGWTSLDIKAGAAAPISLRQNGVTKLSVNASGETVIGSLAGYLKGTAGVVSAVSTIPVADLAPGTNTYVLTTTGGVAVWAAPAAGFTAGGDLTGSSSSQTVAKVNGATVPAAGSLTTGNVLQVSGTSALTYAAVNLAGGANYVTGRLPLANQPQAGVANSVLQGAAASDSSYTNSPTTVALNLVTGAALSEGSSELRVGASSGWSHSAWIVPAAGEHRHRHGSADTLVIARATNAVSCTVDSAATSVAYQQTLLSSGTGAATTLSAQSATTGTGGKLIFASGSGSTANGQIDFQTGSTLRWRLWTDGSATIGQNASTQNGSQHTLLTLRGGAGGGSGVHMELDDLFNNEASIYFRTIGSLQAGVGMIGGVVGIYGNGVSAAISGNFTASTAAIFVHGGTQNVSFFNGNTATNFNSGAKCAFLATATTNPTANPSGGSYLWVPVTSGGLSFRTASGGGELAMGVQKDDGNSGTGTVTIDWAIGRWHKITATGNFTLAESNGLLDMHGYIEIVQDATGSRTVTWPAAWKFQDTSYKTPSGGATDVTIYKIHRGATIYVERLEPYVGGGV